MNPISDTAPGMQVVHLLRAITVGFNLFGAEFAAANDLHTTDLRAIISLLGSERLGIAATPGRLGDDLRLNSASVTALVDRLERMGHVRRERDEHDRRRVLLSVTPSAKELGWAFFGPLMTRIVDVVSTFEPAEVATIERFLSAVNRLS